MHVAPLDLISAIYILILSEIQEISERRGRGVLETTTHACKPACLLFCSWPFSPPLACYEDHTWSPPHPLGMASISLPASFWLFNPVLTASALIHSHQLNLSSTMVEQQPPKSPSSTPACTLADAQISQMKLRYSRLQRALHSKPPESKEEEGMTLKMDMMIKKVSVVVPGSRKMQRHLPVQSCRVPDTTGENLDFKSSETKGSYFCAT